MDDAARKFVDYFNKAQSYAELPVFEFDRIVKTQAGGDLEKAVEIVKMNARHYFAREVRLENELKERYEDRISDLGKSVDDLSEENDRLNNDLDELRASYNEMLKNA